MLISNYRSCRAIIIIVPKNDPCAHAQYGKLVWPVSAQRLLELECRGVFTFCEFSVVPLSTAGVNCTTYACVQRAHTGIYTKFVMCGCARCLSCLREIRPCHGQSSRFRIPNTRTKSKFFPALQLAMLKETRISTQALYVRVYLYTCLRGLTCEYTYVYIIIIINTILRTLKLTVPKYYVA